MNARIEHVWQEIYRQYGIAGQICLLFVINIATLTVLEFVSLGWRARAIEKDLRAIRSLLEKSQHGR